LNIINIITIITELIKQKNPGIVRMKCRERKKTVVCSRLSSDHRQGNGKLGPLTKFRRHHDIAAMIPDKSVAHGQPKADALDTLGLGCKK
jgi:hypothetical protein